MVTSMKKPLEINIEFVGEPAEKLESIVKKSSFKDRIQLLSTALDIFERALGADGQVIVPDSKNKKKYVYKI